MSVIDFAYAELYVHDEQEALAHLAGAMGFTQVARCDQDGLRTVLLRQGEISLLISSGPAAGPFLDKHGDGVADLALRCRDPRAVRAAAIAHGGRAMQGPGGLPAVSAFGDVRHTLLPAGSDGPGTAALPPGRAWTPLPAPAPAAPGPARLATLDHAAVVLEAGALRDYAEYYAEGFGLGRYSAEYVAFGEQAMDSIVVRAEGGGATFTLIEPDRKKQAGQIDAFLDGNDGPGVQHLAFCGDAIVETVRELRSRGVEFLGTVGAYYDMLAERFPDLVEQIAALRAADVLVDRDEWGYLFQIFTGSPYPRGTMFYELVQRSGSRGFGAGNIKALYEAVERSREFGG